jgi:topoisomerase-4 subunit B
LPGLIRDGHLYLAVPPLYRLAQGGTVAYARNDAHKDELMATLFTGKGKVEISRFKGLGEMRADQLRATTMSPATRQLLRVVVPDDAREVTDERVEQLMGRRPELRLAFIQENASEVGELDV